ncbi:MULTISPECIES: alpha/beta fold hydrolase [unclassified Janthinobacterium]|uniref:alpha/beta fold hydrolase n=1 Tax=unclassified Janthinobacterium TaxID=2610881 RepID=UPI00160D81BB|nr:MULTISPECIES: alpha/beta hydrolase [unclassified Janthinobacterium]MBB5609100.1 pimeloyl-ACP methyl ester carboxylesterase [Janthinobacterium sp. S3T4]MBB5614169.1 pimeloyl-ACP methyl ester carboxylesterase [Janthinobacterium sp. S3M3]
MQARFISAAVASAAFLFASTSAMAQGTAAAPTANPVVAKNVVLVHGLYADASSWSEVIPLLQKAGLHVTAVQNPLRSLADDAEATRRVLALQDGATVLVAHSYGGMVISEAGVDPKVSALVYVAARGPDAGEDYGALAAKFPAAPASAGLIKTPDGYAQLSEQAFLHDFAGDLDSVKARTLYAVQGQASQAIFAARTTQAAWKVKPSYYAVSTEDRTINPDFERFMAQRMHAQTIEVKGSHLALISHPQEIAALIEKAAGL